MRRSLCLPLLIAVAMLLLGACGRSDEWTEDFPVDKDDLVSTGRNPYFILEPGYYLVLEGGNERVTITVLNETKMVDGVETRVVEERETKRGELAEISRNYFAIHRRTNDVFYFGEDVDDYKNGKVVSHAGAWLSGVNDAKFGLMMPGRPRLNMRYYNEVAPRVAMDRVEIVSLRETVDTPAGEFTDCLKAKETTPLEPLVTDFKYYSAGTGMVQDGRLKLVEVGRASEPEN